MEEEFYITVLSGLSYGIELSAVFSDNVARYGGAVFIKSIINITLRNLTCTNNTNTALYVIDSVETFGGATKFFNNTGGVIYAINSVLTHQRGYSVFEGNAAESGGAVYQVRCTTDYYSYVQFTGNSAEIDGGALYALGTNINVHYKVMFKHNSAHSGGAVYIRGETTITLYTWTHMEFSFNTAHFGGGIYHLDNPDQIQCNYYYSKNSLFTSLPNCFGMAPKTPPLGTLLQAQSRLHIITIKLRRTVAFSMEGF